METATHNTGEEERRDPGHPVRRPDPRKKVPESEAREPVTLTIENVVYRGKGLAHKDGKVIFIHGVLPGEVVQAAIVHDHKRYADAHLIDVLEASPRRVRPTCPLSYAPGKSAGLPCPGCTYQHVDYAEELRIKQSQFTDLLAHMAGLDPAAFCLPPVPSPAPSGYRNKITLHAVAGRKGLTLGYVAEDNRTVIDIPRCPLAVPPLNDLLGKLRSDARFCDGLRTKMALTLRFTASDGALYWTSPPSRFRPRNTSGNRLTETTSLGPLNVHRIGFFQINPPLAELITARVSELLRQVAPQTLVDLYCGVGVFALAAARVGVPHVLGIDSDEAAIRNACRNAAEHPAVTCICRDAPKGIAQALDKIDPAGCTVIVDPPRRGLDAEIIGALTDRKPAHIVYISCAPDTLARDLRTLCAGGYTPASSQLFDMFPRTPYFETITHLVRS